MYLWTLTGERSQAGANIWKPLCQDSTQRIFRIAAPMPVRPTATSTPESVWTAFDEEPDLNITPKPELPGDELIATLLHNANCRRGPGTEYDIVTNLPQGLTAPIVGRNPDSSWWQVQVPGTQTRCWVSGENVETSGDTGGVPIVEPPPLGCWVDQPQEPDKCIAPCPQGAKPGGACEP
jgi:hypothetical protein